MPSDESRQLAKVAAVAEDLDRILDKLFAAAAELKILLAPREPCAPEQQKRAEP